LKNMKRTPGLWLGLLAVAGLVSLASAQQKFSTTVYFDYAFNLTDNGYVTGTDAAKALNNQFRFRRAYFRYDNKISDVLSFRLTFDADNTGNLTSAALSGTSLATKKDDKLRPFIKHLYVDYSGLLPDSSFKLGMTETLAFKLAEDKWGYRSVAKTLLDIYKDVTGVDIYQSSADLGASLTGMVSKEVRYGVMIANGRGYSHPAVDKFRKYSANVQVIPVAGLSLFGYVDTYNVSPEQNAMTYKADAYLEMIPNLTLGSEWFVFNNAAAKNADGSHFNTGGLSVFAVYKFIVDNLNGFARFDHYDPNTTNDKLQMNNWIVGLDWIPLTMNWRIQPNVFITTYNDSARKTDVTGQMTFFLSF
jgi:hypothetical protein